MHETITGSCLRIVDTEFLPTYREPAGVHQGRALGLITQVDSLSRPSQMLRCSETVWMKIHELHSARGPTQLATGDIFTLTDQLPGSAHGRTTVSGTTSYVGSVEPGQVLDQALLGPDRWVVVVSASDARDGAHPMYVALGCLAGDRLGVAPEAVRTYSREVDGANDLRNGNAANGHGGQAVTFPPRGNSVVGSRRTVQRTPGVGEVMWIESSANSVTRLAPSYLWRRLGTGDLGQRVPVSAWPCGHVHPQHQTQVDDPSANLLCASCRLFGSAGDDAHEVDGRTAQRSYKGHVRVSELRIPDGTTLISRTLPPRGTPRLGSGQMSLVIKDTTPERNSTRLPKSAWNDGGARAVRGRKFYWHAPATEIDGWRRDTARQHQQGANMGAQPVQLVPSGTTITASIWFEGIDDSELGGLIAALDPSRVLLDLVPRTRFSEGPLTTLHTHLGGGKGLGLGSVEISSLHVHYDSIDRYSGNEPQVVDEESQQELVAAFIDRHEAAMRPTWAALAAMLDPGRVNPARVSYPPGRRWDQLDGQHKKFDEPFAFFKESRGGSANSAHAVIPLPSPTDENITLPIPERGQ